MSATSQWAPTFREGWADAAAVSASDSAALAKQADALFVGTGGTLTVLTAKGNSVEFANVPSGTTLMLAVTQVMATGTSASNIVALYA